MMGSSRGFTLLEILLAMALLAMVVAMISLSLSGSLRAIEAAQAQGDIYRRAQIALQRISEDLASAWLPDDVEWVGTSRAGEGGRQDSLQFASMAHVVFDPEHQQVGLGIIRYTVRNSKDRPDELELLRGDALYRPLEKGVEREAPQGLVLSDRLRSVEWRYLDDQGEVLDDWDTGAMGADDPQKRRLPVAVSCRLEYWLDHDRQTTRTFSTMVLVPVGLNQGQGGGQ